MSLAKFDFHCRLQYLINPQPRYTMVQVAKALGCSEEHLSRIKHGKLKLSKKLNSRAMEIFPMLENELKAKIQENEPQEKPPVLNLHDFLIHNKIFSSEKKRGV